MGCTGGRTRGRTGEFTGGCAGEALKFPAFAIDTRYEVV